jgi:hypothetical protein
MRVLRPELRALAGSFAGEAGLVPLSQVPLAIGPRLAELDRISGPSASLALAERPNGVIVGLLEGEEEALRHLSFSPEGRVARGRGEPAHYVATVQELPPF